MNTSTNVHPLFNLMRTALYIFNWRKRRYPPENEDVLTRAWSFVYHYSGLAREAQQYMHVCPQCFAYREVACASVMPAVCDHCGVRTRHASAFILEATINDISDVEHDLRQSLGRC